MYSCSTCYPLSFSLHILSLDLSKTERIYQNENSPPFRKTAALRIRNWSALRIIARLWLPRCLLVGLDSSKFVLSAWIIVVAENQDRYDTTLRGLSEREDFKMRSATPMFRQTTRSLRIVIQL
jgi:hypothetical protein